VQFKYCFHDVDALDVVEEYGEVVS